MMRHVCSLRCLLLAALAVLAASVTIPAAHAAAADSGDLLFLNQNKLLVQLSANMDAC